MAKEIVVISGKGGTGKTSLTASFAALARESTIADCDVDASDLHLVMNPEIKTRMDFTGGKIAFLEDSLCRNCGLCFDVCRYDAVEKNQREKLVTGDYSINHMNCEGCGFCAYVCPFGAIKWKELRGGILKAEVLPTVCQGCGLCNATCPPKAIQLQHSTDNQILAEVNELCA